MLYLGMENIFARPRIEVEFVATVLARPAGMTPAEALRVTPEEVPVTISADSLTEAIEGAQDMVGKRWHGGVVRDIRPA